MTTSRKRKWPDFEPNEEFLKWLTRSKRLKCLPPVSFKFFSNMIENLMDIANQIQLKESHRTLNECAHWYHNAFYNDPSIRIKYEYKLRACPQSVKLKLLQFAADALIPDKDDGFEVNVRNCGRFLFPVSFATFWQYIDRQKPILYLAHKTKNQSQRTVIVANKAVSYNLKRKFYNTFYLFPHRRKLHKCNFQLMPVSLQTLLLKAATPLDELAVATLAKHTQQTVGAAATGEIDCPSNRRLSLTETVMTSPTQTNKLPVTYQLFKRHIQNLDKIVQQMLSCEEYKAKTEDECALAYYKAFYMAPQIRAKFAYEVKPCPAKIRDKLLTVPAAVHETETEAETEPEAQPKEAVSAETGLGPTESAVVDVNCNVAKEKILKTWQGVTYEFPVSLHTFHRYINYDTVKLELAKLYSKDPQKVANVLNDDRYNLLLLNRYYHAFYVKQGARNMCNFNFNAAPAESQQKLLQYAVPQTKDAESTLSPSPNPLLSPIPSPSPTPSLTPSPSQSKDKFFSDLSTSTQLAEAIEALERKKSRVAEKPLDCLPTTFILFRYHIQNIDEIVQQMLRCEEYKDKTEDECARAYYKAFYLAPQIRTKFPYEVRPCPARIREKLLTLPAAVSEPKSESERQPKEAESPEN